MGALAKFVVERGKSLVSKKAAAAAVGVAVVGAESPQLAGATLCVYMVAQAAVDGWKHYVDVRYGQE